MSANDRLTLSLLTKDRRAIYHRIKEMMRHNNRVEAMRSRGGKKTVYSFEVMECDDHVEYKDTACPKH